MNENEALLLGHALSLFEATLRSDIEGEIEIIEMAVEAVKGKAYTKQTMSSLMNKFKAIAEEWSK